MNHGFPYFGSRSLPVAMLGLALTHSACSSSTPEPSDVDAQEVTDTAAEVAPDDTADTVDRADTSDTADTADNADSAGPMCEAPTAVVTRGRCDTATRLGGFLVEIQKDYSIVDGDVSDGVIPASVPTVVGQLGPCTLLKRRILFCNPPCGPGTTCGDESVCVPFPRQQDLGLVTIEGLKKAVELEAIQPGNSYFDTDMPHPAFDPDCRVALVSETSPIGPLALEAVSSSELVALGAQWNFVADEALTITWEAEEADTRVEIVATMTIDQHGNSPVSLSCVFPDTGTGVVPADAVNAMIDAGVSGFPNGRLTRRSVDSMSGEKGCVDLTVSSSSDIRVRVAGFIPCTNDAACPSGQTCNRVLELCE